MFRALGIIFMRYTSKLYFFHVISGCVEKILENENRLLVLTASENFKSTWQADDRNCLGGSRTANSLGCWLLPLLCQHKTRLQGKVQHFLKETAFEHSCVDTCLSNINVFNVIMPTLKATLSLTVGILFQHTGVCVHTARETSILCGILGHQKQWEVCQIFQELDVCEYFRRFLHPSGQGWWDAVSGNKKTKQTPHYRILYMYMVSYNKHTFKPILERQ